jgi:hypothetical protein
MKGVNTIPLVQEQDFLKVILMLNFIDVLTRTSWRTLPPKLKFGRVFISENKKARL